MLIGDGAGLKSGGQVIASRTAIYDIAPTVLEMLGLQPAASMTGRPMVELFDDGGTVDAPEVSEFTASVDGKTSWIVIGRVEGRAYIDEADLMTETPAAIAGHPKVAELQA